MALTILREGNIVVVSVDGRVDGANAQDFQIELAETMAEDDRALVLDLSKVTYISSAGLRVILLTAKALKRQDADLAVCSLTGPISEIFQISGFDKIIPVHQTQPEAIASFAS